MRVLLRRGTAGDTLRGVDESATLSTHLTGPRRSSVARVGFYCRNFFGQPYCVLRVRPLRYPCVTEERVTGSRADGLTRERSQRTTSTHAAPRGTLHSRYHGAGYAVMGQLVRVGDEGPIPRAPRRHTP